MSFFSDFNKSLDDAQAQFGESFYVGATKGNAVSIDTLERTTRVIVGGQYSDVTVTVNVRTTELLRLGIKEGVVLTVRGERVRVFSMPQDGDDTITLNCGSAGIKNG